MTNGNERNNNPESLSNEQKQTRISVMLSLLKELVLARLRERMLDSKKVELESALQEAREKMDEGDEEEAKDILKSILDTLTEEKEAEKSVAAEHKQIERDDERIDVDDDDLDIDWDVVTAGEEDLEEAKEADNEDEKSAKLDRLLENINDATGERSREKIHQDLMHQRKQNNEVLEEIEDNVSEAADEMYSRIIEKAEAEGRELTDEEERLREEVADLIKFSEAGRKVRDSIRFIREKMANPESRDQQTANMMISTTEQDIQKHFAAGQISKEEAWRLGQQLSELRGVVQMERNVEAMEYGRLVGGQRDAYVEAMSQESLRQEADILRAMGETGSIDEAIELVNRMTPAQEERFREHMSRTGVGDLESRLSGMNALEQYQPGVEGSLSWHLREALKDLRDELGLEGSDRIEDKHLKEYTKLLAKKIMTTGNTSYDRVSSTIMNNWVALMTRTNLDKHREFSVDYSHFPQEYRDLFEQWTMNYDIGVYAFMAGNARAYEEAMKRVDASAMREIFLETEKFKLKVKVYDGNEWGEESEFGEINIAVGELSTLLNTDYWAERLLSLDEEIRDQAKKDILEHLVAVKMGEEGLTPARELKNYADYYGGSIAERMSGNFRPESGSVEITGINIARNGEQPRVKGVDQFYDEARWMWNVVEGDWHATLRSSKYAYAFGKKQYYVADYAAKVIRAKDWFRSFGVVPPEFYNVADTLYRDYETERWKDLHAHVIDELAHWNYNHNPAFSDYKRKGEFGEVERIIRDGMQLLMFDKEGFAMSGYELLDKHDRFGGRILPDSARAAFGKDGRFGHLDGAERIEKKATYKMMEQVDWSAGIAKLVAADVALLDKSDPRYAEKRNNTIQDAIHHFNDRERGIAGFREMLEYLQATRLGYYEEAAIKIKDYDSHDPAMKARAIGDVVGKALWPARALKYGEYFANANETRGVLAGALPQNTIDAAKAINEKGYAYLGWGPGQKTDAMRNILDAMMWSRSSYVMPFEMYKTDKGRTVKLESEPDIEGLPVFEKFKTHGQPGRRSGYEQMKTHMKQTWIHEANEAQLITVKDEVELTNKYLRTVPILSGLVKNHPRLQAALEGWMWTERFENTRLEGLLYGRLTFGVGSVIKYIRTQLSYIIWEDFWLDLFGGYKEIVAESTKQAIAEA